MSDISAKIDDHDTWLDDDGPAAIVFRRKFKPVEGHDSWIFPPTFAKSESADDDEEGAGGTYQIDPLPENDARKNVCLIDSVGSQANRIEPIFKQPPYNKLVPQYKVSMKDGDEVNILDVGHRAADAAVRFSKGLGPKLWSAFDAYRKNRDCSQLARLAPTSLVFGVWDSRGTGEKIQRIVRSVIRAYNVTLAKRRAVYKSAYDYIGNEVISSERGKGGGKNDPLSQEGFNHALAPEAHGGVLVKGGIYQEAVVNLVALRTLTADLATRRYLLALALLGLSYRDQKAFNLREGCLLCAETKEDFDGKWKVVNFDGTDSDMTITHNAALAYAKAVTETTELDAKQDEGPDNAAIAGSQSKAGDQSEAAVTTGLTRFKVEQPTGTCVFDKVVADEWLKIEKPKDRRTIAKRMHPSDAIAERRKKAAAADPLAKLRNSVEDLKIKQDGTFNKPPHDKLTRYVAELIAGETSDAVKTLASRISEILQGTDSADGKKKQMLSLFPTEESGANEGNAEAAQSKVETGTSASDQ